MSRPIREAVVTGASGFIGSHLVELLVRQGVRVRALARSNSEHRLGNLDLLAPEVRRQVDAQLVDVLDPQDLRAALGTADTVFHLAAQINVPYSMRAPALFLQTNGLGTQNVLQAALDLGVERVVVISSSEVYGGTGDRPLREEDPLCARSPYAASKVAAEKMAQAYFHTFGLGAVVVRPFNTFGPRQSLRAVIPWVVSQALAGDEIELGNLKPVRDFVFVADTAAGMLAAGTAEGIEGETLHLATGVGLDVETIVRAVGRVVGRPLRIRRREERARHPRAEVWKLVGDAAKAQALLGWAPAVSFEEGLERVVQSMRALAPQLPQIPQTVAVAS